MKHRFLSITVYLLLAFELTLLVLPQQASAYSNQARGDWKTGGPHRTINEFAIERFIDEKKADPILSRYDFGNAALKVNGPRIGEPGTFLRGNLTGAQDQGESFQWWVKEGGYSADEPELYASFRHFYDPRYREMGTKPYLTDHLNDLTAFFNVMAATELADGSPITAAMLREIGKNPAVDARDWAVNGSAHAGWGENEYSWNKGVQYMQQALASTDAVQKSKLFAQAWRSLGETMHLLADMTTPAHVRNDSHPAKYLPWTDTSAEARNPDPSVGFLKADPYESFAQEGMIRRVGKANVDPKRQQYLDQSGDPLDLFDRVASFTNASFFSGDTISGNDTLSGAKIHNANGMPDYPSPKLEKLAVNKNHQFVETIDSHTDVCMALSSWISEIGWGTTDPHITSQCVESQASVLVPFAVAGDAKLMDWFIPRVKVEITDADTQNHVLRGTVTHEPYGAYKSKMNFNTAPNAIARFFYNDMLAGYNGEDYQVEVNDGDLQIAYKEGVASRIDQALAAGNVDVRVEIEMGGILVRSNDLTLTQKTPTPTPAVQVPAPGTGVWVLKLVQPDVGKTEVPFSYPGLACTGGTKVSSTETSGTTTSTGTCQIKGAVEANATTQHSWSRPPDRLIPGQEVSGTLTVSESGLCSWNSATDEGCQKGATTSHSVWLGMGWPGGKKEFLYDNLIYRNDYATQARALDRPMGSFKWAVPDGSGGNYTLVLQFVSHSTGGQVYTNFWYAWNGIIP